MEIKCVEMDKNSIVIHETELRHLLCDSYTVNFDLSTDAVELIVKDKLIELKKHVSNKDAYLFGLLAGETLIAFVWFFEYDFLYEKRMHINQIVVAKAYQGQGLSKELLKKVEEFAKRQSIHVIDLYVSTRNEPAKSLYQTNGFTASREYLTKEL